ncbi:MAG: hypothetical protein IPJ27_00150 [Candidatus Accumulibacter sp.]|uniref:Uncharacterized protein n=1 Tax=Candidatus Accumulibacter proximus TaxID=2954385 RepID=A0A935PWD0_9PROT|nr:hypothetical protein [Candidatus Accumulibacter proximus]
MPDGHKGAGSVPTRPEVQRARPSLAVASMAVLLSRIRWAAALLSVMAVTFERPAGS